MPRLMFRGTEELKFFGSYGGKIVNASPGEMFGCSAKYAAEIIEKFPHAFEIKTPWDHMDDDEVKILKPLAKLTEPMGKKELKAADTQTKELKTEGKTK